MRQRIVRDVLLVRSDDRRVGPVGGGPIDDRLGVGELRRIGRGLEQGQDPDLTGRFVDGLVEESVSLEQSNGGRPLVARTGGQ